MARQDWKKKLYIIWENIKSFAKNSWMWFKEKCAYLKTNFEKSEAASCNKEMPKIFNPKYFEPRTKPPSFVLSVIFTTIKVLVISLVVIACIGMGVLLGIASSYTTTAPNLNVAVVGGADRSSVIYDCYGNRVASYASIENRIWASYDEIPQTMIDAIVSIEDTRFFMHNGVDTKRLFGAIVNNITGNSTHGGSTITQQLIKLTVLTSEQTFKRKIQEAFLALELETKYSKEQILEAYLNTISLGGSNYGIKTAAMDYFGKELHELTIKECAILAGLAQNPSYYNPRLNYYVRDNYEATENRTRAVLKTMYESGRITYDEYQEALEEQPVILESSPTLDDNEMLYFIEYVIHDVKQALIKERNLADTTANRNIIEQELRVKGYNIYTTLDTSIQKQVEDIVFNWDKYPSMLNPSDNIEYQSSDSGMTIEVLQPQCAMVITDPHTGHIKAIIGGRTAPVFKRGLNRAYQGATEDGSNSEGPMPIGSSIKPITVYAPALDNGKNPGSRYYNVKSAIPGWVSELGYPRNYGDKDYTGRTSLRQSIITSANTVAAQAFTFDVGIAASTNYLSKLGVNINVTDKIVLDGSGLALGTSAISMLDLSSAYAALANGGVYMEPLSFTRIEDSEGTLVYDAEANQRIEQVYKASTAYMITDILEDNVKTSSTGAQIGDIPVAGKTGTNQDNRGISFAGYTPYYSAALYIGHDAYKQLASDATGARYCIPLWQAVMEKLHENLESKPIYEGSAADYGVEKITLCDVSGMRYTDACKANGCSSFTDYVAVDSPEYKDCTMHQIYYKCSASGKYATKHCPDSLKVPSPITTYSSSSVIGRMTDEFRAKYAVGYLSSAASMSDYLNAYENNQHLDEVCNIHTPSWTNEEQKKAELILNIKDKIIEVKLMMNLSQLTDDEQATVNAKIAELEQAIDDDLTYAEINSLYSDFLSMIDSLF